jgi:inosose dehydratase
MQAIRVGNAPCSWGSLEFEGMKGEGILYPQMLDELVETGYVGTEFGDWGFMPTAPDELRAELQRRGVSMVGAFVPVALKYAEAHEAGAAEAVKIAKLLASVAEPDFAPFIVLADNNGTEAARTANAGRVTPDLGLSDQEWTTFAAGAERVARAVRQETGLRTAFHHHCGGYVETPDEIAELMRRTDPALLGLVFDTGHYAFGAGDRTGAAANEGLARFSDRIWHMHFKDCSPGVAHEAGVQAWDYFQSVAHGVFCELGKGCIDFPFALDWMNARSYTGFVIVEQDVLPGMGVPKESARRNRDYLKSIGL